MLLEKEFPTEKPHISYSEFSTWKGCSWKHKLKYIEKLDKFEKSIFTESGSAVHDACENFLKTKIMNIKICHDYLEKSWEECNFNDLDSWKKTCENMLIDLPTWLDQTFQDWECYDAEENLYEQIDNDPLGFKGFIDAIIVTKDKSGKNIYWLLDWKTASWGWRADKKRDFIIQMQLVLYKKYWSKKHNIPLKDIRCGFVLLKRNSKKRLTDDPKKYELVKVSVGDKALQKSDKHIKNMLSSIRRGIFIKNRNNCKYCPFFNAECV